MSTELQVEYGAVVEALELLREIARMEDRRFSRDSITYKIGADTNVVHLLESNRFRHLAAIYNDSTAVMYLKLGANAGTDDFTTKLNAGDYYETPAGYTGPISAVWASVNGQARVTELAQPMLVRARRVIVLTWDGADYQPSSDKTSPYPKEFRGPTDPNTVAGVVLNTYDVWVQA